MKALGERLQTVKVKGVATLGLCVLIAFLLRPQDRYKLQPSWVKENPKMNPPADFDGVNVDVMIPLPLVTDLESDGINEVVLVARNGGEFLLKILATPDTPQTDPAHRTLPHVEVRKEVVIPVGKREHVSAQMSVPVAMTTGYLEAYQSMVQVRKQVIVIATSNWHVFCYDHDLNLLWHQQLMSTLGTRAHYQLQSMGVLVVPHPLNKVDRGAVVIAGSYEKSIRDAQHVKSGAMKHRPPNMRAGIDKDVDNDDILLAERDNFTHFSTFALGGNNGSVIWHHLPSEFDEKVELQQRMFDAHHWKLGLKKGHMHSGEVPWNNYHRDIVRQLPYKWKESMDTKVTVDRFSRHAQVDESNHENDLFSHIVGGIGEEHIKGYAYGGQRPHSASEHVRDPNVIVTHNQEGVEVLNLLSGQPLTRWHVLADSHSGVFGDMDDDGLIEHIYLQYTQGEHRAVEDCHVVAETVFPVKKILFKRDLCKGPSNTWLEMLGVDEASGVEDTERDVAPMLVKSIAQRRGIIPHLTGDTLKSAHRGHDAIFFLSNGHLTSYGPSGELHWQVQTPAKWNDIAMEVFSGKNTKFQTEYSEMFLPSMGAISFQVYGPKEAAVLAGWDHLALVDLKAGILLGEHSLPCVPSVPVVTGDFDNDGWTDVIVTCHQGYFGFSIQRDPHRWSTFLAGFAFIFSVMLIMDILLQKSKNTEKGETGTTI